MISARRSRKDNLALGYTYDANGNILTVSNKGATVESYEYDALDRLISTTCGGNAYTYTYIRGDKAMIKLPDVEVLFEFNGTRKTPVANGYRPAHLVTDNYLTTGIHHYYGVDSVPPNGIAKGTITFISPEAYPCCLWIGKKINIQEGERVVGYATISDIYNSVLENKEMNSFVKSLIAVLDCAEKEKKAILDGKKSLWNLEQIQKVIVPEISELLSYASKGEIYFKYGRKQRLLESSYLITDSLNDLSNTALGKCVLRLQNLYDAL